MFERLPAMSDDFCLIHGYEHMKSQWGNPIPYCEACENEREEECPPFYQCTPSGDWNHPNCKCWERK